MTASTHVHIGTSGYSYKDWKGPFYPAVTPPKGMLAYYAEHFDTVELNFSYYRQPTGPQLLTMADTVETINPQFRFTIKAYRGLTHEIGDNWKTLATHFHEAVYALHHRDRLACVLLQFPYSFHYTVQNRRHLKALLESMVPLPCACEFRCREWLRDSVIQGLRTQSAALVAVDEPQLDGLLPPEAIPTGEIGYVRFHGRNAETWWQGDSASRYDYLYNADELNEWIPRLSALSQEVQETYIYFNNHWRGQAIQNAVEMATLLTKG
ncbi:MAG: DUF72 domain-containing protein [Planctomycetota bacterium]|jgi:uncharacterized protein YecE (DUF72 family)